MSIPQLDLSQVPEQVREKFESQLSRLPAIVRTSLETQLAKLPPDQLAQLLAQGSPTLDKLLGRAEQARPAVAGRKPPPASLKPSGHFNQTVQAGDRPGLVGKVLFVLGTVVALYYLFVQ